MKKFKSELLYSQIIYEDMIVGLVRNILVDNTNGVVLAIAIDKECKNVIPMDKTMYFNDKFYLNERYPVFESKEIIKYNRILKDGLNLEKQLVRSQNSNEAIGKLTDYSINMLLGTVSQIEVTQSNFLFWKSKQLIDANKIYLIDAEVILIKEKFEKIKKAEPIMNPA